MLIRKMFCKTLGVRITALLVVIALMSGAAAQQVFTVGAGQPVQLDPAYASSDAEILVLSTIYDYLVGIDADNNVIPGLATEWTVSEDGLTYTFSLAEGVTWHDGSDFSASDVVWTFDRLRDPDADLPTTDLYSNIETIEATGDLEVTFSLAEPNAFFLYDLSDNHALIVQEDAEDLGESFVGTGPFILENYSAGDRMSFRANPDYFVDGQPGVEQLEILFFSDESAAVSALRGGQIDLAMRMATPLYQSLEGAQGINRVSVPTNSFNVVRLRTDREPGNDPRVVEALRLSVDRQAIVEAVTQGLATVGNDSPVGPLYEQYYVDVELPERDPERASELLAEAGYPDGLSLDLHTPDTGDRPDLAVVLQEQLAPAGFDVNVIVEPESVYYGENNWLTVDFGITSWGSRPYPQFYLDVMLVCGARWNEAHFCDEEFDELAQLAGTTTDEQERIDAYAQMQQILVERGSLIVPYFFPQYGAIDEAFEGLELQAFPGRTNLALIQPTD